MKYKSLLASEDLARYVNETILRESELLKRLRAETEKLPNGRMQISSDQGAFLSLMTHLVGARRALEIGTFTGYSAICIAGALPDDGRLTACDVSEEWTSIARRYWHEAGLTKRIELRLAPALDTLRQLMAGGAGGTFDLVFIDADTENYEAYYDAALVLLRSGGLIVMDNVLHGNAIYRSADEPGTLA